MHKKYNRFIHVNTIDNNYIIHHVHIVKVVIYLYFEQYNIRIIFILCLVGTVYLRWFKYNILKNSFPYLLKFGCGKLIIISDFYYFLRL